MYRPDRMSFGIFLAPFHALGENPTLALHRDIVGDDLLAGLADDGIEGDVVHGWTFMAAGSFRW